MKQLTNKKNGKQVIVTDSDYAKLKEKGWHKIFTVEELPDAPGNKVGSKFVPPEVENMRKKTNK